MKTLFDPRTILLFAANALLLYLTLLVNSSLAAWSLHLVLLGPMVVLPALYLHRNYCFICILLTGLWVDAALPAPFGLFTIGFLAAATCILCFRMRFRPEHNYHPILLAHLVNLLCILLLTFAAGRHSLGEPAFWTHVAATVLLSHLALLPVAPWFFNLERLLFELFHTETEPEDLPFI